MNEFWPEPPPGTEVVRLRRLGAPVHYVQYARVRLVAPLGARRPRARISRHAIDHALHVAAWGSHTCRPFPVATGRA